MSTKTKGLKKTFLVGVVLAMSAGSLVTASEGYVQDSAGDIWVDSYGNCWRSSFMSEEGYTEGCDPEPVAVVEPPAPIPVLAKITLQTETLFDFDRSELRPAGVEALQNLAADINALDDVDSITVDGYTDSTGPEEYNLGLSERRAASVKAALVDFGIPAEVIETQGFGESNPVASNDTREGRQLNRRAEVTVVGDGIVNE